MLGGGVRAAAAFRFPAGGRTGEYEPEDRRVEATASLTRVELLSRLEQRFELRLPTTISPSSTAGVKSAFAIANVSFDLSRQPGPPSGNAGPRAQVTGASEALYAANHIPELSAET
jgi:hypothetical protein